MKRIKLIGSSIIAGLLLAATQAQAQAARPADPPPRRAPPTQPAPAECSRSAIPFLNGQTRCAPPRTTPDADTLSPLAALGELLFEDTALSASGKQSCASCHDPATAYSASDQAPVPLGGAGLTLQGLRNAPSLMYASFTPPFRLAAGGRGNGRPAAARGGFMRDGRIATLAEQAQRPFITSFEMANTGAAQVAQRLATRPYLAQFTAIFGTAVLDDADATLAAIGQAIAAYEIEDADFHPFSSKYDAVVNGSAQLSAQEAAGLQAFVRQDKGHCASCHTIQPRQGRAPGAAAQPALFTDFSFHVLGVPRNWNIAHNLDSAGLSAYVPANGAGLGAPDHAYYDLGLCGPLRTDLAADTALCGSFKVPTLRNVALKQSYFHNGVFTRLEDVLSWYATRNSNAAHWYQKPDGTPDILYNDLPVSYTANVEPVNRPGQPLAPDLNATDIQNLLRFLCTLNDGFDPANPDAYNASGRCHFTE